jgi:hypothetical protein
MSLTLVGIFVGDAVGAWVGLGLGAVGAIVLVGDRVMVGGDVGCSVGMEVGDAVGLLVGAF